MGITLGDLVSGARRRAAVCAAVAEYAGLWGWAVVPGAHLVRGAQCSCGQPRCPAPGGHPLQDAEEVKPGSAAEDVRALWDRFPGATALLPAGRSFDVVEVSERAGCRALARLERMGTPLGPVLATPDGRARFLVAPGAAAELPELLYKMGWDDAALDLRPLGLGDYVTAPPCDLGGLGAVQWLRPPTLDTAVHPPEARLVLGTLAYACHWDRRPAPGGGAWLVPR